MTNMVRDSTQRVPVKTYLEPELKNQLEQKANDKGLKTSSYIRMKLKEQLQNGETQ